MAKPGRKQLIKGTTRPGWFTAAAVLVVLAGIAGAFVGYDALSKPQPNTTVGYGGMAALVAAIAIALLLSIVTKQELEVGTKGIKVKKGFGQPVEIAWSEPHDYYYLAVSGASTPSVERASLRTADGRRIDVADVKLPEHPEARVPALVEQYSTAANLPKIREQLDADEDVDFGAVRLNGERIEIGDVSQPMKDGIVLQIERGLIRVGCAGKWTATKVSARDVANYPCLLRAVGQISQALPPS